MVEAQFTDEERMFFIGNRTSITVKIASIGRQPLINYNDKLPRRRAI